jgi:thiol-disulfide isomerase/thioredoxin
MKRLLLVLLILSVWFSGFAAAQEIKKAPPRDFAAARLLQNPDDALTLQTYVLLRMRRILPLVESEPDKAQQQVAELRDVIDSLRPKTEEAQEILAQAKQSIIAIEQRLKLPRISLEEAAAALKESPADADALSLYLAKANSELYALALHRPDEAVEKIDAAISLLREAAGAVEDEALKRVYAEKTDALKSAIENALARGRELFATLGKPAAPLDVETWLSGEPLSPDETKGKVVLLDFWAVWCPPCIANMPRLNAWQEKYGEKGLVVVGLTHYHNYTWDEAAGRAVESLRQLSPDEEQETLKRFAAHHKMQHRIAIGGDGLEDYYHADTVPHLVLLDRAGAVRMYDVGGSPQRLVEMEAAIEKLLAEPAP